MPGVRIGREDYVVAMILDGEDGRTNRGRKLTGEVEVGGGSSWPSQWMYEADGAGQRSIGSGDLASRAGGDASWRRCECGGADGEVNREQGGGGAGDYG